MDMQASDRLLFQFIFDVILMNDEGTSYAIIAFSVKNYQHPQHRRGIYIACNNDSIENKHLIR
jgi:hypothetical protein